MFLVRVRSSLLIVALVSNLVLAGSLGAGPAHACTCAGIATPTEGFRTSDAVFAGEVIGLGLDDPDPQDDIPLGGVEFGVRETWKGLSERSVVVYGQGEGYGTSVTNTCDVVFDRGKNYLVYAFSRGEDGSGLLGTNVCTPTKPLAEAGKDLQTLGSPTAMLPDTGGFVSLKKLGFLVVAFATNLVL